MASKLEKEWNHLGPKPRRFKLPKAWSWEQDPGGGHLAGALMLLIGLVGLAYGHWEFGAFMAGLGLILLLALGLVQRHFRRRKRR